MTRPKAPVRGVRRTREGIVDEDAPREEDRSPEDQEERQSSGGEPPCAREERPGRLVQEGRGGRLGRRRIIGQLCSRGSGVRGAVETPPITRPGPSSRLKYVGLLLARSQPSRSCTVSTANTMGEGLPSIRERIDLRGLAGVGSVREGQGRIGRPAFHEQKGAGQPGLGLIARYRGRRLAPGGYGRSAAYFGLLANSRIPVESSLKAISQNPRTIGST